MSITSIHKYAVDLNADTLRDTLRTPLAMHNAQAQTFALVITDGGAPATLTGAGCTGYFIRADGYTVTISGTVSGNIAMVTLPAACYAVQGRCKLSVNVTVGSTIHTLLMVEGYADRTRTDAIVDDSHLIPSIDELLAQISAMEAATTAATTATSSANTAASAANTAATRANTAAAAAEDIADLTAQATTLAAGSSATASYANGVLTIGVPTGPQGPKGDMGPAGPTYKQNYLDNTNFATPVNQRGKSSYTSGYTIDRWTVLSGTPTITVGTGGVTFAASGAAQWGQYLSDEAVNALAGKEYTIAVCTTGGIIAVATGTLPATTAAYNGTASQIGSTGVSIGLYRSASGRPYVRISASSGTAALRWAALYAGTFTSSALPDYVGKGYGAELVECVRYYKALNLRGVYYTTIDTKRYFTAAYDFGIAMRAKPTITITGATLAGVGTATSPEVEVHSKNGIAQFSVKSGSPTAGTWCSISGYASADL